MAHYFRDERVGNVNIDPTRIEQLSAVFADRARTLNATVPVNDDTGKTAYLTYIIRFENKGYRVFTLEELLRYFHQAKNVERVLFTVETGESLRSNRQIGTYLELRLEANDPNLCLLTVTSDEKDWVDASFSAVQDILNNSKNGNRWVRTAWTQFGVQISGVTIGFILCLWIASKLAPSLAVESPFVVAFLFMLLIFSNCWTYLNQFALWALNRFFPNVQFIRPGKERLNWLMQALIGGIVGAFVLYLLSLAFTFFMNVSAGLVRKGP